MRPPKFIIGHNEAAQPGAAFVVHTQDPSFIGKVVRFEREEELQQFVEANECVVVDSTTVIHIEQYLTSNDKRRINWLKNKLKYWFLNNSNEE